MPSPLLVTFLAGNSGSWRVTAFNTVTGEGLRPIERLSVFEGNDAPSALPGGWSLRGLTSNTRYTHRHELTALQSRQEGLSRPRATLAALIPIRKTEEWWNLAQDERRAIFEEKSRHIGVGLEYLPAIARRLHHSRELGEPFDFLTWFEYAPEDASAFETLVRRLRETEEWRHVDREVDIRLARD